MNIKKQNYLVLMNEIERLKKELAELKECKNSELETEHDNILENKYVYLLTEINKNKDSNLKEIENLTNIIKYGEGIHVKYNYATYRTTDRSIYIYFIDKDNMTSRKIIIKDIRDTFVIKGYRHIDNGTYKFYGITNQNDDTDNVSIIEITLDYLREEAIWNEKDYVSPTIKVTYDYISKDLFKAILKECEKLEG